MVEPEDTNVGCYWKLSTPTSKSSRIRLYIHLGYIFKASPPGQVCCILYSLNPAFLLALTGPKGSSVTGQPHAFGALCPSESH